MEGCIKPHAHTTLAAPLPGRGRLLSWLPTLTQDSNHLSLKAHMDDAPT